MPHDSPLIALLSIGFGLAFVFGALATRLKLSPLVGYLVAGVVIGPFTPGFTADADLASEVAEIGVILLMFGVGLHFSPKDLLSVRAVAVPVALLQIVLSSALGIALALWLGWSIETGVVLGLALSVSSTVVALRSLQERRLMQTERGKLTVGWLVVEDLAMVVAMVLLPTWAHIRTQVDNGEGITVLQMQDAGLAVALTLGKVALFALIMLLAGKRVVPWLLHRVVHMGSRELFRLAVLAIGQSVLVVWWGTREGGRAPELIERRVSADSEKQAGDPARSAQGRSLFSKQRLQADHQQKHQWCRAEP